LAHELSRVPFPIVSQEFNAQTAHLEPGLPTPVIVEVGADRTFKFQIKTPPTALLLKRAAGITSGSTKPGSDIAGNVSLKHIYEIAKIKLRDGAGIEEEQVRVHSFLFSRDVGLVLSTISCPPPPLRRCARS
jgi:ribosomal protein L11